MSREWEGLEQALHSICASNRERGERVDNHDRERRERIQELKQQVRDGEYRPDVKDIARLLTSAMDPTL